MKEKKTLKNFSIYDNNEKKYTQQEKIKIKNYFKIFSCQDEQLKFDFNLYNSIEKEISNGTSEINTLEQLENGIYELMKTKEQKQKDDERENLQIKNLIKQNKGNKKIMNLKNTLNNRKQKKYKNHNFFENFQIIELKKEYLKVDLIKSNLFSYEYENEKQELLLEKEKQPDYLANKNFIENLKALKSLKRKLKHLNKKKTKAKQHKKDIEQVKNAIKKYL